MRRTVAIVLTLGATCLLFLGCSNGTDPVPPTATSDSSLDKKAPDIPDPPEGFDPELARLSAFFGTMEWAEIKVRITPGATVPVYSTGNTAPILCKFVSPPGAPEPPVGIFWDCTIWIPEGPESGYLNAPGNAMIYRTEGFPNEAYGAVSLSMPFMSYYDPADYTGEFVSFAMKYNENGWPYAVDEEEIFVNWPPEDPELPVYMEIQQVIETDGPDGATDRVIRPAGDDPGEEEKR